MVLKYLLVAALVIIAGCSSIRKHTTSTNEASVAATGSTAPTPPSKPMKPNWMQAKYNEPGAKVPPMDPSRKINEQDCTSGGVDFTAGNLRCK